MIGHLTGTVFAKKEGYAILSASGVGYKVFASRSALSAMVPGEVASLWTHLAVREDALDLYGFESEEELRFFDLLLSVSGIGPRSALAILDIASVETLRSAIAGGNAGYLTSVSGIGKKTADRIVMELRDKVGAAAAHEHAALQGDVEALEALKSLGYTHTEARDALRAVPPEVQGSSARLREALKTLGNH